MQEFKNQRAKIKMTTQNAEKFDFCSVTLHFYFCFLRFRGVCLKFGN